jgi:PAS domain S-box-containing protein
MTAAGKGTIMVVDDQPLNLKLLEEILRPEGHRVRSFPRGRLALASAAQNPPDLVLLDINMPEMNGFEVCRRFKDNPALAAIPVIFLSAMDDLESKVKAFGSGGVDYVTKPFQAAEVQARVETHLALFRLSQALRERTEALDAALENLETAHRALSKSESLYRRLVDDSTDAVLMADRNGAITSANQSAVKLFGVATAADLVGRHSSDFAIPDLAAPGNGGGRPNLPRRAAMEARIRRADGAPVDVEVSVCSFLDGERRVFSFLDLTARMAAESQIRRLSQAVELAQEAICLLGIDGKVLFANPAFLHLAHLSEGELRDRRMRALFGEAEVIEALDAAIAGAGAGRSWQGRIAARFAAASPVQLDVAVSPVRSEAGQIDNLVATFRDVTAELDLSRDLRFARGEAAARMGEILIEAGAVPAAAVEVALERQTAGDPRPLGEILIDRGTPPGAILQALNSQIHRFSQTASAVRLAQKTMEAVAEKDLPVYSICQPLADAGGDTFSCVHLPDGAVLLVLADVAGHSVLSSYAVACLLGMISAFAQEFRGLEDFVLRLNAGLGTGPFHEIPICVLAGHWRPGDGRLHLVNAGIPHGVWFRRESCDTETLTLNGTPLGVLDRPLAEERVLLLSPGDRLLLATDGMMDALSPGGVPFQDRVAARWSALRDVPLCQALPALCEAAREHGGGPVADDILAVAVEQPALVLPPGGFQMRLRSRFDDIDEGCVRLERMLESDAGLRALSDEWRFNLVLAAREALTNAMIHGNGRAEGKRISLACRVEPEGRRLRLTVTDEGTGFDWKGHRPGVDLQTSLGGRGITIIRAFARTAAMTAGELEMEFSTEDTRT